MSLNLYRKYPSRFHPPCSRDHGGGTARLQIKLCVETERARGQAARGRQAEPMRCAPRPPLPGSSTPHPPVTHASLPPPRHSSSFIIWPSIVSLAKLYSPRAVAGFPWFSRPLRREWIGGWDVLPPDLTCLSLCNSYVVSGICPPFPCLPTFFSRSANLIDLALLLSARNPRSYPPSIGGVLCMRVCNFKTWVFAGGDRKNRNHRNFDNFRIFFALFFNINVL